MHKSPKQKEVGLGECFFVVLLIGKTGLSISEYLFHDFVVAYL